jgi:hypothetical protein
VGAAPGVPPSLPGFSGPLSPRVPGGCSEQTFEQAFPTELMEPTRISAGVDVVLSVSTPLRSTSWPISFSAEKLPVSFAQMDSPLMKTRFFSVVERCTQPTNFDGAGTSGCGAAWP